MLGHVVARFLEQKGCDVVTSERRYEGGARDPLVEATRDSGCKWVVNALGRIKQKSSDRDELIRANAVFPLHLSRRLTPGQRLIQAGTDCVFSGATGSYSSDCERDATDDYGWSKILGEAALEGTDGVVIRTSIIGPERDGGGSGLMGWFLRQTGDVNGYTNHLWNGVTTLEWAKVAHELMRGEIAPKGNLAQAASASKVSKCELLQMIAEIWGRPNAIHAVEAPDPVDRTLAPDLARPGIAEQLKELRGWH